MLKSSEWCRNGTRALRNGAAASHLRGQDSPGPASAAVVPGIRPAPICVEFPWSSVSIPVCLCPRRCVSSDRLEVSVVSLHLLSSSGAGGDREDTVGELKQFPGEGSDGTLQGRSSDSRDLSQRAGIQPWLVRPFMVGWQGGWQGIGSPGGEGTCRVLSCPLQAVAHHPSTV